MPSSKTHEVMTKHTYFEYEEFEWHKYRSFSAKGDGTADVRWPEYTLEPDQRISERRETYMRGSRSMPMPMAASASS
jgi:hypothetical protein